MKKPMRGYHCKSHKIHFKFVPRGSSFCFPPFPWFCFEENKKKRTLLIYISWEKSLAFCIFGRLFFFPGNYFTSERALFHYSSMNNEKDFRKSFPFSSVPAPASFPTHMCIDYVNTGQRVSVDIVGLSFLASKSLRLQNDNHCCL